MPDAGWHALRDEALQPIDHAQPLAITAALCNMLANAAADDTVLAIDEDFAPWRLRKVGGSDELWRAQALNDSRSRIFTRLRCLLSSRLSSQFLHDLRNPINALSLPADLLARMVVVHGAAERSSVSVRGIRARRPDLRRRHKNRKMVV